MNKTNNNETVASAQPFLDAEKEQMEKLKKSAKETGESTRISTNITAEPPEATVKLPETYNDLPEDVVEQLKELQAIKDAEKLAEAEQSEIPEQDKAEEDEGKIDIPPEIQKQLDELQAIKDAKKEEEKKLEEDPDYVKFNKPYSFEGKTYNGIKLEFDEMTGADILEAEEEYIATNAQTAAQTPLKELSKGFLAFFAARACAQPIDFIMGLDGRSFSKVTRKAQTFLLSED